MERIAYIEKFKNGFGQYRFRFFTVRADGTKNRSLKVWTSRAACKKALKGTPYTIAPKTIVSDGWKK